ncbi:MAG: putative LPS assembly protein LptD [Tenacibaculum sp.]
MLVQIINSILLNTKIVFIVLPTNLRHILLATCLLCFVLGFSQNIRTPQIDTTKVKHTKLLVNDTVNKNVNTLKQAKDSVIADSLAISKEVIEDIINHDAEDYTIQDAKNKTVILYNQAHVTYTDLDLKAGIITIDYKNNTVYAKGIKDSLCYHQSPQFKQGGQESEQDSILFNFKTKKALIYGVKTVQSSIITYGEKTKRVNDSTIYMRKLRFTTSQKKIPDYYIATDKAKLVPGEKIIVGGSYLVLADVPTPLFLPFAYFPLTNKRSSGFIIPTFGETNRQGFFLQGGGYYLVLNDYMDLTVLGDLYTNSSWGFQANSNYYVRYKFSGDFSFRYEKTIEGIRGLSGYSKSTNFNLRWNHSQDAKLSPNSRFTSSVNLGSSQYYNQSLNQINVSQRLTNSFFSSVSYYKKFLGTPFNMTVTGNHQQNTNNNSILITLPLLQLNMDRIYPFTGKGGVKKNPIQKMGLSYSSNAQYRINTTDEEFLTAKMFRTAKSGIQHNLSTNTNIKLLKFFTLAPSVSYKDVWYFNKINKRYDTSIENTDGSFGAVVNDTINGFNRFNEYNFSASISTSIYGTFNFKKGRLKTIRHTFRPSVSYGYRPDFAKGHNLQVQQSDDPADLLSYSPFEGGIYGTPSGSTSNSIGISLNNVLEAKVAPKDPDSDEEVEKISILNNLNFNTSYNITADSLRWSPVTSSAGTRLFKDKLALNINATLDPYQVNSQGQKINAFNPNIFRLTNAGITANYSFSSKDFEDKDKKDKANKGNGAQNTPDIFGENLPTANGFANNTLSNEDDSLKAKYADLYKAKIPWSLNLVYSVNYSNTGLSSNIGNNSLMFSGNVELSPKWKVNFSSGYDIKNNAFTFTSLNFSRDLDSWRLNFNWTPFGRTSYYFFIGVKSSVMSQLKWDKYKPSDRNLF